MSRGAADDTILAGDETVLDKEGYGGKLSGTTAVLSGDNTAEFLIVTVGPLNHNGTATGVPVGIRLLGEGVGVAGGTIARYNRLQTNSDGEWVAASSGESAIAIALEAAADGEEFNLLLQGVSYAYPEA